jgi:hypothetical protein
MAEATAHKVETSDPAVRTDKLFNNIIEVIDKYLWFHDEHYNLLIALWIMGTYLHKSFTHYPYLILTSMQPGCGKTTLCKLLNQLSFSSQGVWQSITPANLFRSADGNTLIIDEYEDMRREERDAIDQVLRGGFEAGSEVPRQAKVVRGRTVNRRETYETEKFPIYGPKIIASIADQEMRLQERGFEITMIKKPANIKRAKFNIRKLDKMIPLLKTELLAWESTQHKLVALIYQQLLDEQTALKELSTERLKDLSYPLLAIATAADAENNDAGTAQKLQTFLLRRNDDAIEAVGQSDLFEFVKLLLGMMDGQDTMKATPGELERRFPLEYTSRMIGRKLTKLGFRKYRVSRETGVFGYEITKDRLVGFVNYLS